MAVHCCTGSPCIICFPREHEATFSVTEHDIYQMVRRIVLAAGQRVLDDLARESMPNTGESAPAHHETSVAHGERILTP